MSFYGYRIVSEIDKLPQDVAILYKFPNGTHDRHLDETIDELTKRRLPPDRIVIICPKGMEKGIVDEYASISNATKERLRAVSNVVLAHFDHLGKFEKSSINQLHSPYGEWSLKDSDFEGFLKEGMKDIIKSTGTRMIAPAGYVFRKPSENSNRVFIRAGNMMKYPPALAVIFHAMVRTLPIGFKRLYIDSFTILSIVLTYQRCMSALAKECGIDYEEATITNFHSYSMDENLNFEATNDYIVLISASSSGGLAAKLVNERHARPECLYHLLVFSEKKSLRERSVYFEWEKIVEKPKIEAPEKVITIPGEEFMASHGDTRTVDLKIAHLVTAERKIYKDEFYQQAFVVNLRAPGAYGSNYRPVSFSAEAPLGTAAFLEWMNDHALIEMPISTRVLIATDNARSNQMADYLVSKTPASQRRKMKVLTLGDLLIEENLAMIAETGSVLVVCSDESDGESLLAVSQALRNRPHIHRHYVIGHLFPTSSRQFKRLKSNLRVNGKGKEYGWSVYCVTPIGDELAFQTWLYERDFDYSNIKLSRTNKPLLEALTKRTQYLNGSSLAGNQLFLPRVSGEALELRDESVLFEKGYKNISQVTIFVQIAAALQRARDQLLFGSSRVLKGRFWSHDQPEAGTDRAWHKVWQRITVCCWGSTSPGRWRM